MFKYNLFGQPMVEVKRMDINEYNALADELAPKPPVFKNCLWAFLYGGVIGMIGQFILEFFMDYYMLTLEDATPLMIITMVFIASVLTGFGLYDKLAKKAGAGTFVPITGFANSMTSSAMEGKSEGLVLGIGANMFKLGGTVITFGIVSSFVLGGIRYVFEYFW